MTVEARLVRQKHGIYCGVCGAFLAKTLKRGDAIYPVWGKRWRERDGHIEFGPRQSHGWREMPLTGERRSPPKGFQNDTPAKCPECGELNEIVGVAQMPRQEAPPP